MLVGSFAESRYSSQYCKYTKTLVQPRSRFVRFEVSGLRLETWRKNLGVFVAGFTAKEGFLLTPRLE